MYKFKRLPLGLMLMRTSNPLVRRCIPGHFGMSIRAGFGSYLRIGKFYAQLYKPTAI